MPIRSAERRALIEAQLTDSELTAIRGLCETILIPFSRWTDCSFAKPYVLARVRSAGREDTAGTALLDDDRARSRRWQAWGEIGQHGQSASAVAC